MSRQEFTLQEGNSFSTPNPLMSITMVQWGGLLLLIGLVTWQMVRQRDRPSISKQSDNIPLTSEKSDNHPPRFTQPMQWVSWGKELEQAKQYEAAVAVYDEGLQQYPNDFRLWHERGLVLAKLQRFEEAIASYDRAYQIRPQQRELAHERGDSLLQLERYEEAIASFNIFLKYDPNNAHILSDQGYAFYCIERYEDAVRSLNQALKTGKSDRNSTRHAHFYQIESLRQLGRTKEALQSANQAMRVYPDDRFKVQQERLQEEMRAIAKM
jgi:tetratricopeptide (TPR) repeat protein